MEYTFEERFEIFEERCHAWVIGMYLGSVVFVIGFAVKSLSPGGL